jgi:hypothetical protein
MPAVELPSGQSAIIHTKDEISERTARRISRAYMLAAAAAAELANKGFDVADTNTWSAFSQLEPEHQDALDGYQAELIVGLTRSWSLDTAIDMETVLDIPRRTFEALAGACGEEFNRTEEFGPDGAIDPKAPTAG